MAARLIEGFDHYNNEAGLNAKNWFFFRPSGGNATFLAGRWGGNCMQWNTNNNLSYAYKILPSSYSTIHLGLAYYHPDPIIGKLYFLWLLNSGAGTGMRLAIDNASRTMRVTDGSGTDKASGTYQYLDNVWNSIEVKLVIAGASGSVQVRANGVVDIATTTANFGSSNVDIIQLGGVPNNGQFQRFDDLYILDTTGAAPLNDFLGDSRVETIVPTGAGSSTVWTPNGGANWDRVDDSTPDSDTTYVQASAVNDKDTYVHGDLTASAGQVFALQHNLFSRKTDTVIRKSKPVIRHSGVDYDSSVEQNLGSSYAYGTEIIEVNPGTGVAWTVSDVNAAQFGMKVST